MIGTDTCGIYLNTKRYFKIPYERSIYCVCELKHFILKMSLLKFIYGFDAVPHKISKDIFMKTFELVNYPQAKISQDTPVK